MSHALSPRSQFTADMQGLQRYREASHQPRQMSTGLASYLKGAGISRESEDHRVARIESALIAQLKNHCRFITDDLSRVVGFSQKLRVSLKEERGEVRRRVFQTLRVTGPKTLVEDLELVLAMHERETEIRGLSVVNGYLDTILLRSQGDRTVFAVDMAMGEVLPKSLRGETQRLAIVEAAKGHYHPVVNSWGAEGGSDSGSTEPRPVMGLGGHSPVQPVGTSRRRGNDGSDCCVVM